MAAIQFTEVDAWLLYSIPLPGASLGDVLRWYNFTNRTYPPTYEQLADCLRKSLNAGIVEEGGGKWFVDRKWYKIIHRADETAENEIDSMLAFQDFLLSQTWPQLIETGFVLDASEYDAARKYSGY